MHHRAISTGIIMHLVASHYFGASVEVVCETLVQFEISGDNPVIKPERGSTCFC